MKLFSQLKTSEKISLSFSLFGFLSLLLFLFLVNITYFSIWYNLEKQESFEGITKAYQRYIQSEGSMYDIELLKNQLLLEDSVLIPEIGGLLCSPSLYEKIDGQDIESLQDNYVFRRDGKIFFIYSRYFEGLGVVKIFFDTTVYFRSQMIIIEVSLLYIFLMFLLQFIGGKYISRFLLRDLKTVAKNLKNIDIHKKTSKLQCQQLPKDDEIQVLVSALNQSFDLIEKQTHKMQQFITDVSHEFKTPLMAMNSRIDVLEKKKGKGKVCESDFEKMLQDNKIHIQKLNSLLETLFLLTRIDETNETIKMQSLQLYPLLESRKKLFDESYPHKTIHFWYDFPQDLMIQAESQTCMILLDNLLSNAIKFSPDEVHIRIYADQKKISISDNGVGIESDQREKIFEKFYRKDTKIEGFGVGLYLVKRIVDLYKWKIEISDNSPNGTIFTLNF